MILDRVFQGASLDPLAQADEAALIGLAQAGDEDAMVTLLLAYAPVVQSVVKTFTGGPGAIDEDEVRGEVLAAFVSLVHDHDASKADRLAGRVRAYLHRQVSEAAGASSAVFEIPGRTLRRYFGIMREADGDVQRALDLAPSKEMSRETFLDIHKAVQVDSLDYYAGEDDDEGATIGQARPILTHTQVRDADEAILVRAAFDSVNSEGKVICAMAYGFAEPDPVPDAEIAHRLGLGNRLTVLRKRNKALDKMRAALGVDNG